MTFDELEQQLFQHTEQETAALRMLSKQVDYLALERRRRIGSPLTEEEASRCEAYEASAAYLPWHIDRRGYADTDEQFGNQRGYFHLLQHPRYCAEPTHRNHYFEILVCYAGECSIEVDDTMVTLREHDVCLLNLTSSHRIMPLGPGDIVVVLRWKESFFSARVRQNFGANRIMDDFFRATAEGEKTPPYLQLSCKGRERLWPLFRILCCEYWESDLLSFPVLVGSFNTLFAELSRAWQAAEGLEFRPNRSETRMDRILEHISSSFRHCTLDATARQFGYSPTYLSAMIKEATGSTFSELRKKYRLTTAADMLLASKTPVNEIAENVGYKNLTYFYAEFRKQYEMTPQEYRDKGRAE